MTHPSVDKGTRSSILSFFVSVNFIIFFYIFLAGAAVGQLKTASPLAEGTRKDQKWA